MKSNKSGTIRIFSDNYALMLSSLCILVAAILAFRCFNAILYPTLHCEDGTEMLAYYLNNPYPSEIFRFYNGYISLFPNLIAFLAISLFPIYIVPYIWVVFSLGLAMISLTIFSWRRYRFVTQNDKSRILVCLILALFPLGNVSIMTSLAYSLWHIFIISLLLIIAPLPRSHLARLAQFLFLALAIFSNPLSVLFIPICLVLFFLRPTLAERISNSVIIVLVVIYASVGIEPKHFAFHADVTPILITFKYIAQRILFEPVFGSSLRMFLYDTNQSLIINMLTLCMVGIFLLTIFFTYRKERSLGNELLMFVFLLFVIFSITFISVVGRSMTFESHISSPWEHRYFYTQQLLFIFMMVLRIVDLVYWEKLASGVKIGLLLFLLGYFSYLNIQGAKFFRTSKELGIETIQFLKYADSELSKNMNRDNSPQQLIFHKDGTWDIKINLYNNPEHQD